MVCAEVPGQHVGPVLRTLDLALDQRPAHRPAVRRPGVVQGVGVLDRPGVHGEPHLLGAPAGVGVQHLDALHLIGPLRVGREVGDHLHHPLRRGGDGDRGGRRVGHGGRLPAGHPGVAHQRSTYGRPVSRKCPTLTHSVRPTRARAASGWCTWPNSAARGRSRRISSSNAGARRLGPPGPHVVGQLGHRGRGVAAQHVDRGQCVHGGGVLRGRQHVRGPRPRRAGARPGGSGTPADEPEPQPADVDHPVRRAGTARAARTPATAGAGRRCPGWRRSGRGSAPKRRSYCSRMACSTTAGASGTRDQASLTNRTSSPGAPPARSRPNSALTCGPSTRPMIPAAGRGSRRTRPGHRAPAARRRRRPPGPARRRCRARRRPRARAWSANLRGPPVVGPPRGTLSDRRRVQEGPTVREYSVPASVRVGDQENLVDAVYDTAARHGSAVVYRRRGPDGGWADVTAAEFADQVTAVARGLIAAGVDAGDRVALLSRTRYEWTLFDYAILAAGAVTVPIYETSSDEQVEWILSDSGAVAVVVESAAHAAVLAGVAAGSDALRRIWQIEPPAGAPEHPGRGRAAGRAGLRHRLRRGARPAPRGRRRRPGHADLHLRHHRPAEGLRAHPPQPALRGQGGHPGLPGAAQPDRLGAAVPAAGARVRQGHPVRGAGHPDRRRAHRATCRTWSRTSPRSVRRSCSRCRGCSRRSTTRARQRAHDGGKGRIFDAGRGHRDRLEPSPGRWPARTAARGPARAVRPAGLPQAAGRGRRAGAWRRCPAAPRSASGSGTSSAGSGCRCWRATG